MERDDRTLEPDLADALRRLTAAAAVPPVDPSQEAALLAAFDAAHAGRSPRARRDYWYLSGWAAAAAVLLAVGLPAARAGRHDHPSGGIQVSHTPPSSSRGVQFEPPSEFVIVPGAAELPRMESGTLVRMDLPVSMLPSLGVMPSSDLQIRLNMSRALAVTADVIVAQDGLPRAVRLVSNP